MGAEASQREAADRKRPVVARKQGAVNRGYPQYGLVIPNWLAREITVSDNVDMIEQKLRGYEFMPELTDEGILYRPTTITRETGW